MTAALLQIVVSMLAGILAIIVLTTRFQVPVFFSMLIACFITGLGVQMPLPDLIQQSKTGFGNVMQSLGFIIVLGTALGILLEHTGSTRVMAEYILKKLGEKRASLAIGITGFIVGLPIFCDSGYIVLSGLNKSLIKKTGISVITMSVSLASGLYVVHCLLPPHPGAAAAAVTMNVDFGPLILFGIIVAAPVILLGHWWAVYMGKKVVPEAVTEEDEIPEDLNLRPSAFKAFLPVLLPIVLIAARSIFMNVSMASELWFKNLLAFGDPVIALAIGVLFALNAKRNWDKKTLNILLHEALEKASGILVITGAGGAFGAILAATNIGQHFAELPILGSIGLLFPFLLAFVLKTAQGSSTVAIITAASIVLPLLPILGLDSDNGRIICVLTLGAGSMMISHANDSYFWVIAKFSGIDMKAMLKAYSTVTILMGTAAFILIWILSKIIL